MGSKSSPSAPVCSHSPDAVPIDSSVHQVLLWTATSSLDDLVVCHYHEGSMTWRDRDWLVVQMSSRWYGLPSEVVSLLQCPTIFAAQSGLAPPYSSRVALIIWHKQITQSAEQYKQQKCTRRLYKYTYTCTRNLECSAKQQNHCIQN